MNYNAVAQTFAHWFDANDKYTSFGDANKACYEFLELLGFSSDDHADVMNEYWAL